MTISEAQARQRKAASATSAQRSKRRHLYVVETEEMLDLGFSPEEITRAIGTSREALARGLYREHRGDLARQFGRHRENQPTR